MGVLKANSVGQATITATVLGTNITTTMTVNVAEKEEIVYQEAEIYQMSEPSEEDSTTVTNWIIDEFSKAAAGGYKKIVFPKDKTYSITPNVSETGTDVIVIPSNMAIDFNGTTLNIEENNYTQTGYEMFSFTGTENSYMTNGVISGERYRMLEATGSEQCKAVAFKGCSNCGLVDMEICDSPGFNIITSRTSPDGVGGAAYVKDFNIEAGGYDDNGTAREEGHAFRTIAPFWFSSEPKVKNFQLGSVWRTAGRIIDANLYDILFYDSNGDLLTIKRNCMKYYTYELPENADKFNIVFHQEEQPVYTDYDYAVIFVYPVAEPHNCYIRNCSIHDNYSTGIAMCGGQHWLMENNKFYNNGVRDPLADVDYEDGWESMIGDIWRYNNFEGMGYGFTMIAGQHIALHNNYFHCWFRQNGRCNGIRIYNNHFVKHRSDISLNFNGDCVFAQNLLDTSYSVGSPRDENADYKQHIIDQF